MLAAIPPGSLRAPGWAPAAGVHAMACIVPTREGERVRRIAGTRCPRGQLSVISAPGLAVRSASYLRGMPVPDPPGGDHQVSGS
jgi:hypothetical protein